MPDIVENPATSKKSPQASPIARRLGAACRGLPWLDPRETHRRWWTAIGDGLDMLWLAPRGLERALAALSRLGIDTSEMRSWDDVRAWFNAAIQVPPFAPAAPAPRQSTTRIDIPNSDADWRVRTGKCSGPPPPERQRRLCQEAPVEAQLSKSYFRATSQKYSNLSSGASAASENEDFCGFQAEKNKASLGRGRSS